MGRSVLEDGGSLNAKGARELVLREVESDHMELQRKSCLELILDLGPGLS